MVDVHVIPGDEIDATDLEPRVRRLEDAVAARQKTQSVEERVAARVVQRLKRAPLKSLRESAADIVDAGRMLLPKPQWPESDARDAESMADAESRSGPRVRAGWWPFELWSEVR